LGKRKLRKKILEIREKPLIAERVYGDGVIESTDLSGKNAVFLLDHFIIRRARARVRDSIF